MPKKSDSATLGASVGFTDVKTQSRAAGVEAIDVFAAGELGEKIWNFTGRNTDAGK